MDKMMKMESKILVLVLFGMLLSVGVFAQDEPLKIRPQLGEPPDTEHQWIAEL